MILKPSDFYILQDNMSWYSSRNSTFLSIGDTYKSFAIRVMLSDYKLKTAYFQELIKKYPENITINKSNNHFFDYYVYITFVPSLDTEWQEIVYRNSMDITFSGKPNIFSSVTHAIEKIKEFKIIKKTTDSLLLCQFGEYEKFIIYTNSSKDECNKIYQINVAHRDNKLFRNINEPDLLSP